MFLHLWSSVTCPIQDVLDWNDKAKYFSMDATRLVGILRQETTVIDRKGAKDFPFIDDSIKVENITLSYNEIAKPLSRMCLWTSTEERQLL